MFAQSLSLFRTDAKTVSILALGCFHPVVKVQSASIHFFLGSEEEQEDDKQEEVGKEGDHLVTTVIQLCPWPWRRSSGSEENENGEGFGSVLGVRKTSGE